MTDRGRQQPDEPTDADVTVDDLFAALGLLPEVIGIDDVPHLNLALAEMFLLQRQAAGLRAAGKESEGVLEAVRAAWTFVSRFDAGVRENLVAPLMSLGSALMALDTGTVDPLLRPRRTAKSGRTPDTIERQALIGWAVGAVGRLRWTGLPPGKAHRAVADVLHKLGVRPNRGSGRVTARTVREWCERVAADVGGNSAVAIHTNAMLTDGYKAAIKEMLPQDAPKLVLRILETGILFERGGFTLRKPPNPVI